MKTRHKIAIARAAYGVVHRARSIVGMSDRCVVTRGGARYDLDLSQGIDLAIYLGGIFEKQTQNALRRLVKPGDIVLDIGANIGAHTLLLAQLVGPEGKALAFEATGYAYEKLRRNLELNPTLAARTITHQCFLTSNEHKQDVPDVTYASWPLNGQPGLHAKHFGRAVPIQSASSASLDDMLREMENPDVRVVKMDVDGYECQVLSGAKNLISKIRPIFVLELSPYQLEEGGSSIEELLTHFVPNGYRLYHERTMKPLPPKGSELRKMIGDAGSINAVALPH